MVGFGCETGDADRILQAAHAARDVNRRVVAAAHRHVVEVVELTRTEVGVGEVRAVSTVVGDRVAVVDLPSEAAVHVEEDVTGGGHHALAHTVDHELTRVEEPSAATIVLVLVVGALTNLQTVEGVDRLVLRGQTLDPAKVPVPVMVPLAIT